MMLTLSAVSHLHATVLPQRQNNKPKQRVQIHGKCDGGGDDDVTIVAVVVGPKNTAHYIDRRTKRREQEKNPKAKNLCALTHLHTRSAACFTGFQKTCLLLAETATINRQIIDSSCVCKCMLFANWPSIRFSFASVQIHCFTQLIIYFFSSLFCFCMKCVETIWKKNDTSADFFVKCCMLKQPKQSETKNRQRILALFDFGVSTWNLFSLR